MVSICKVFETNLKKLKGPARTVTVLFDGGVNDLNRLGYSHRTKCKMCKNKPFNDLPLIPPKAEIETRAILKKAIHPFTDGNGRTGRILNILYLTSGSIPRISSNFFSTSPIARHSFWWKRGS